jgi:hypothetical protein
MNQIVKKSLSLLKGIYYSGYLSILLIYVRRRHGKPLLLFATISMSLCQYRILINVQKIRIKNYGLSFVDFLFSNS